MYFALQQKQLEETYARLTTPYHKTQSHFTQHQSVQGMYMGQHLLAGSDRLLLLQNSFGAIQLGYAPREGKTFLFANAARTSFAYRNAQTRAYNNPRHNAIFYQSTAKPWSAKTLARQIEGSTTQTPSIRWLARQVQNQKSHPPAAYQSLFPFAQRSAEHAQRMVLAQRCRTAEAEQRTLLQQPTTVAQQQQLQQLRTQQREALHQGDLLASILYRKDAQSLWFFQQANRSFDAQKQEIYTYYKTRQTPAEAATAVGAAHTTAEPEDDTEEP